MSTPHAPALYAERWAARRPHLPMPVIDASVSSTSLEMFISPGLSSIHRYEGLFDMDRPMLAGFFIPPFQRPLVWDIARKQAFCQSVYLGIHLGTIVFNDASNAPMVDGKFHYTDRWLIDGQQRLNALNGYVSGDFAIFVGTPNEHRWDELNKEEQRVFENTQIGTSKLNTTDEAVLRRAYDLLNFGGVAHTEDQRAS